MSALFALFGFYMLSVLAAFSFGWWWRGLHERTIVVKYYPENVKMTSHD